MASKRSCRSHSTWEGVPTNAQQQALLIRAQSRMLKMECELSQLRREAAAGRLVQTSCLVTKDLVTEQNIEREHKLEKERSELITELAAMKTKLADAEKELLEEKNKNERLKESYDTDTQALKNQVENLMKQVMELDSLNDEMQAELNEMHLLEPQLQLQQVEELQEHYSRSVEVLKARITELEAVESKLLSSQTEVKCLQHQLRIHRQDTHLVETMRDKILQCEALERRVQLLTEENHSLCFERENTDLLRYQVQSLKKKCEEFERIEDEVAQLRAKNSQLMSLEGSGAHTSQTLQVQLAELQQREVVSLIKHGELATKLKVCEQELSQCQEHIKEIKEEIKHEKATVTVLEGKVQKLERRLIFVTKERDGCVNVLNSYKLDSGVDAVMKDWIAEMRLQLERSGKRIAELEHELESHKVQSVE